MPAHANAQSTEDGNLIAGTKVDTFVKSVDEPIAVHRPISGRTLEFDGSARCVKGCD